MKHDLVRGILVNLSFAVVLAALLPAAHGQSFSLAGAAGNVKPAVGCWPFCPPPPTTFWKGGPGNWSDRTKWTNGVPTAGTNVNIDGGNPVASPVSLGISGAQAHEVTIDSDDGLSFNNGTNLTISSPSSMINNGKITLNSTGAPTALIINNGALVVNGTLTLTDSASPQNFIYSTVLENQGTIRGAGSIQAPDLINHGTILANTAHVLLLQPGSPGFTNGGTLQVSAGSVMHVFGGPFTNFSGSTLTSGTYDVSGKLEIDQLGNAGGEIVTNAANIFLDGSPSSFVDAAGKDVLSKFATNATDGTFTLRGKRAFTTAGNFSNAGTLIIGSGSTFTVAGTGTALTQTAGKTTDDGTLNLPSLGTLNLNAGSLFGKGTISGALKSSATITPGDSSTATGILRDTGKYTQNSGGTLDISIEGTVAGNQYDQLNPTTATLNGTLNINRPTGFVPGIGTTFKIMNFTSESGKFTTVNGLAIDSGEHFTVTYQPSDVLLSVVSGPCCSVISLARFEGWSAVGASRGTADPGRFGFGLNGNGRNLPHLSPRAFPTASLSSPVSGERLAFRPTRNFSVGVAPHSFVMTPANGAVRYGTNGVSGPLRNIGRARRTSVPRGLGYHLDLFSILGSSPRRLWRDVLGPNGGNFGYLTVQ